jgi:hypothetical protein
MPTSTSAPLPAQCCILSRSRNEKTIVSNQAHIQANQATINKNQAAILKNQNTLKTIVENQKQILAPLKP